MGVDNQTRDRLLMAAGEALRANRLDAALESARLALDLDPACVAAKFIAGVAYSRVGDSAQAVELLSQVLSADPRSYEALISLSTVYRQTGALEEAVALGHRAVEVRPADPQAHNNLGRSLLAARRLEEAANAFSRALAGQPGFAAAHYNLGKTRQLQGKDGEAAQCFARAASLAPTLDNLIAYGQMRLALNDLEGAIEVGRRTAERYPDAAAAHLLLCGALIEQNETEEAEDCLRRALDLDGEGREDLQIAARQLPLGHIREATDRLRRVIARNPRQVSAYESLTRNQKITEEDRELVDAMRRLLDAGGLSPTELGSLHYALGKSLEDLGEYESAMRHFDEANRMIRQLKFGDAPFDEARHVRHVDRMIGAFSPSQNRSAETSDSNLPLLIVGMMRSGTTLAEQILSSHPDVAAAGEQLFWSRNWVRAEASPDECARVGHEYVAELSRFGPHAARVTDKLPGNYMFAGLIHRAVPNARIVHMRRDPVDTCLSIWSTPNHVPSEGGHDKRSIVFVYREYLRLMRHWRSVLPSDRFLEVDYEALVGDRERETRRLIDFCGLDWDDACLHPEANARPVSTLSVWQVRQPVYGTSVRRWRKFEPWLGEFADLRDLSSTGGE